MYVDLDKNPGVQPYYEMTIPESNDDFAPGKYFHKENFILFNLAVGGMFPGIQSPSGITALNDLNGNKASMYVNYVRIYQKGTADESFTSFDEGDGLAVAEQQLTPLITYNNSEVLLSEEADISVYNMLGTLKAFCHGSRFSLDDLLDGVYLIRVKTGNGGRITKKIIKTC